MSSVKDIPLNQNIIVILIYFGTATIACFIALLWLPASYVDGQYIPVGPDSFYHAARIIDTIETGHYFQFDSKIHAPEGSLLTWPWLYDYLIYVITKFTLLISNISDPAAVLTYIPPLWCYVNGLILLGITTVIGLSVPLRTLVLACFAVSPLTQELHGAGRIDHHYMEFTMVLLTLFSGLYFFKGSDSVGRAILLGICLAFAQSINNGLFILQFPFLAAVFILWLSNKTPQANSIAAVGFALILTTLVVLLPSQPYLEGKFEYYYLSWFHLYIASCSALVLAYTSKYSYSFKTLVYLLLISFLLSVPIGQQIYNGSQFLLGDIVKYDEINETNNIVSQLLKIGISNLFVNYTGLLVVTPLCLLALYIFLRKTFNPVILYYFIFSIAGTCLLLLQQRMHYFGLASLLVSPFLIFHLYWHNMKMVHWFFLVSLTALLVFPGYIKLEARIPYGGSLDYAYTRHIYPVLSDLCKNDPGVVLADFDDGNYIRYHTGCSMIANNMIVTPQHQQKVLLIEKLFSLNADQFMKEAKWIKYIYIRRQDNILAEEEGLDALAKLSGIRKLLLQEGQQFPEGFHLLKELVLQSPDKKRLIYARLFKVDPRGG